MLEALISLRRSRGEGAIGAAVKTGKNVGDILVVKTQPCVWSDNERRFFLIVEIEDEELETRAASRSGIISLPYAEHNKTTGTLKNRSRYKVSLTSIDDSSEGLDAMKLPCSPTKPKSGTHFRKGDLLLDLIDVPE